MHSTADYHSVSNAEIERAPHLGHQTATRGSHLDDESDNSSDFEGGLNPNVNGNNNVPSKSEARKHANDFCIGPGPIDQESWGIKLLSWTWEFVLTALPLFFIAVTILAIKLDQQVRSSSNYGGRVEEITRLGPTIYPILFAMVVARFYRNIARWYLERPGGITISSLEQIFGSQSFASALERLIIIRGRPLLGSIILLSWTMSPIGGQSSSRLLRIEKFESFDWLYYDNMAYKLPIYVDMDFWYYGMSSFATTDYSASLLSSRKQQQAFVDLWGRPKIPQWPWDPTQDLEEVRQTWRETDRSALEAGRDYYTSLIGINVQGLSFVDNSTQYKFDLESGYINFNCSMIAGQASLGDLEKIKYPKDGNSTGGNLRKAWPSYWGATKNESPSFSAVLISSISPLDNPYLLYATHQVSEYRDKYAVFNCTTATINLRTGLICTTQGCRPQRQRRIRALQMREGDLGRRLTAFENTVALWSRMAGVVTGEVSATDTYIADGENTFGPQYAQDWTGIDTEMVSRRLTTAFNTVWELGSYSYNLTKSSSALPEDPNAFWTNRTQATITRTEQTYYVNKLWAVILILTTIFLQTLAICGLVLKCLIRGPDILGFTSSLTRDNAFVPISGGSFQGGAERARSLKNMRVQLADVQPRESRGYIALSAVPSTALVGEGNDEDGEKSPSMRQLEKKRMYM